MASRKHGLVVSLTDKRGLHVQFRKKPSERNRCIGDYAKKQLGPKGTNTRAQVSAAFKAGVAACSGVRKAKKAKPA